MAVQGKGILGNPVGPVGNIHFYDRLGKTIVQSNPPAGDSFLTAWPLIKWRMIQRLTFYWVPLKQSWKDAFLVGLPPGMTTYEHYLSLALANALKLRQQSAWGSVVNNPSLNVIPNIRFDVNWNIPLFRVWIDPNNIFWSDPGTISFGLYYYKFTAAGPFNIITMSHIGSGWFEGSYPRALTNTYSHLVLLVRRLSPSKAYGFYLTDFFNPITGLLK